ncbi:MAG: hypothetical protein UT01_C0011G0021 [Candidatus Daviesbacteria bacterium GW2011_GWA1_38_7]|nr:MAG: hypothetical protein UT01_C0011G0021 [Candidatus Daviesbacteria bacterium GW2011_GWA1_38_7]
MDFVTLSLLKTTILGFVLFSIITHPKSFIWNKLPTYKKGKIQVFPSIRLLIRDRIIHLHHWFNFAILLLVAQLTDIGFLNHNLTQGILIGGMIQGLTDPHSRKLIYKKLKRSETYHHTF